MSGECHGPVVLTDYDKVEALQVSYTPAGVVAITLTLDGVSSVPIGARSDQTQGAELTRWSFDDDSETFVGLQAFQTDTAIRSLQVITLDRGCLAESFRKSNETDKEEDVMEEESREELDQKLETSHIILIVIVGFVVFLALFIIICMCIRRKNKPVGIEKKEEPKVPALPLEKIKTDQGYDSAGKEQRPVTLKLNVIMPDDIQKRYRGDSQSSICFSRGLMDDTGAPNPAFRDSREMSFSQKFLQEDREVNISIDGLRQNESEAQPSGKTLQSLKIMKQLTQKDKQDQQGEITILSS